ncbi:hypothetical protein [Paenibacillus lignilyticus]|uniref:Uncharacterized protein n=1 Tax=Paenibacillus lignilyticus TaxID=1172615 RepID=A0ABS5CAJ7_9BACL|nr:hypothetical protein [Paenibacillus lignilyticus]MBP3963014.1 hypothetical protein [Paenibacillus lignilyticus]
MKGKTKRINAIIGAAAVVFLYYWLVGFPAAWTIHMADIANNTEKFTDKHGYAVTGKYSVSVDLADLESNVGKELYNDGAHRIYVMWIDNAGLQGGGYRIGFRAAGTYSHNGASLISGTHHKTVGEQEFATEMTAKMTAEYKGNVYESATYGTGGLNYKDGDEFSFYLFPNDAYEKDAITLSEKGVVRLTVTGLYQNLWSRNP